MCNTQALSVLSIEIQCKNYVKQNEWGLRKRVDSDIYYLPVMIIVINFQVFSEDMYIW